MRDLLRFIKAFIEIWFVRLDEKTLHIVMK